MKQHFLILTISIFIFFNPIKKATGENSSTSLGIKVFATDSSINIKQNEFNKLLDSCTVLLQTKKLKKLLDAQHIQIMMCLNTIQMRHLKGVRVDLFINVSRTKKYVQEILKIYPDWSPNQGMGYYFHKLKMQLAGTPSPYAYYKIID